MVRTSQPEQETTCFHPEIEKAMYNWLQTRSHPAFLLIGSPGIGKTTLVYRVCKEAKYWIQEFNASHTRTGSSFRQTIMPLLVNIGVSKWIHPSTPNGRAVLLDEMDGLSQGEKGGLQELLDYLKSKRDFSQDAPLILICNILEGRIMQQLLKYCCVRYVQMPSRNALSEWFKKDITDFVYRLGDIRKVSQSLIYNDTKKTTFLNTQDTTTASNIPLENSFDIAVNNINTSLSVNNSIKNSSSEEDDPDKDIHIAIQAAWFTLYDKWAENEELDLETKDANLAGLLFHQNLPQYLESGGNNIKIYNQLLNLIRWSDRADFWAFFHQCWNLLPLSYRLKLKYPNIVLQYFPKARHTVKPMDMQYTQVLTKQSALFNSWKEMNRISAAGMLYKNKNNIEYDVPFRCVSQWATYQSGKQKDTLGLIIPISQSDLLFSMDNPSQAAAQGAKCCSSSQKKALRGKKSNAKQNEEKVQI
jgi:hypothetical protein